MSQLQAEANVFDRAALLIEHNGWWDGDPDYEYNGQPRKEQCVWSAVQKAAEETTGTDAEVTGVRATDLLATQLGVSTQDEIWELNDSFAGRAEEGKAWAIDTLKAVAASRREHN